VSTAPPVLFAGLIDDAAVFPPGSAPLPEAVKEHRRHRAARYAPMIGPLLVPASAVDALAELVGPEPLAIGVIGDTGVAGLRVAAPEAVTIRQVEVAVAKRGEDPQPGLRELLALLGDRPGIHGYAEVPLTWGLLAALDALTEARGAGVPVAAKFRTGGLAAELFPTPIELAAVVCACRDRALPFKLTAGLHHAIRRVDPETGFVHHGFLNVLVATAQAAGGAEVAEVGETLAGTDPVPLIEAARRLLDADRPLWIGFGSCSVAEPVADLTRLGLLPGPVA
jgi:hypothetical protein